jgi:hypothetical protein
MTRLVDKLDREAIRTRARERLSRTDLANLVNLEAVVESLAKREFALFFREHGVDPGQLEEGDFSLLKEAILSLIEEIFHELAVGQYQLSEKDQGAISRQVTEQFHKAFWDLLRSDLEQDPPKTDHLLSLLEEIKHRVNRLTPNNKRLHEEMDECLDLDYFRQLFQHRVFTMEYLAGAVNFLISERLKKMVAPVDDAEISEWQIGIEERLSRNLPYGEIVPEVLKGLYHWIERIEHQLTDLAKRVQNKNEDDR